MTRFPFEYDPEAVIGTNIRHLREDAGLTVSQLSERLGWPAQRLWEIEAGEDQPVCTEMNRLRHAFGCGFEALFAAPRAERRPS